MSQKITLMLVDDHKMIRMGLAAYFTTQADIEVVAEAESGQVAIDLIKKHVPDIVLMDLNMPEMDGVEATRQLRNLSPRTQIIILTSHHDDEHIFPAIRAGALSYLLKDIDPDDLADVVRKAYEGEAILNPRVAARVVKEMQGLRDEINPFTELTDREMEILRLIASGGMNNKAIADELVISEKTVKSHVTNILSKLHLQDRTEAAVYAWKNGVVQQK